MNKPPFPPRDSSPARSFLSLASNEMLSIENDVPSLEIKRLFSSFEEATPFSQLDEHNGRGSHVISQTNALLSHIWSNRDPDNPSFCLDKHEGRHGTRIYDPPRRGPGGIMIPCVLSGAEQSAYGQVRSVNIVNNHINVRSAIHSSHAGKSEDRHDQQPKAPTRPRQKQLTFRTPKKAIGKKKIFEKDNRGRFTKKSIVANDHLRRTAPAIPLQPRGLRRLLKQWVVGESERGLQKALFEFTAEERNGRDHTGKSNKPIFSRRRTVAVATMLCLQDAFENEKSFAEAMGLQDTTLSLDKITMSMWERTAKEYLQHRSRRMTQQELRELGDKIYRPDFLNLLPRGED